MIRFIVRSDPRSDGFEDIRRDGSLVICVVVLADEFLDLGRGEHPADVEEDFNVAH